MWFVGRLRLNHNGYFPEFVTATEGKDHDVMVSRTLKFPKGSIIAVDKGYNDRSWFNKLTIKGVFFVTRLKSKGITSYQAIEFTGPQTAKKCPTQLRRIEYKDKISGKHYIILTNNFKLSTETMIDINKARWQVELFFKWIKQKLKNKDICGYEQECWVNLNMDSTLSISISSVY